MAPPKYCKKSAAAKDAPASEFGGTSLRQLRMQELSAEFSRQERELKKLMRSLGKKLSGK